MSDVSSVARFEPMIKGRRHLVISLLLIASLQQGHAANTSGVHPYMSDKFFVDIGVFWPSRSFSLSVNGSAGEINDPIEFEEDVVFQAGTNAGGGVDESSWRGRVKTRYEGLYANLSFLW
jgi:hypothetical protein